jgi:hypothetical protein
VTRRKIFPDTPGRTQSAMPVMKHDAPIPAARRPDLKQPVVG